MVSDGGLTIGSEIRFGALSFVDDGLAWLQEAPLNVEALSVDGAANFCAITFGILLQQSPVPYHSASLCSTGRFRMRSGCSQL